jgi:radical SAM protein with 4Fe4S-binding SPASM domain
MRIFEGCNLHCEHCFIPKNPKRMSIEDVAASAGAVRSFAKPGQRILLQWHGGEPTMFGPNWLREAISAIEEAGPEFVWDHGIQTNLMTYSTEWADLYFEKFGGNVGVSWDPVIRLLRAGRPETNADYEVAFRKNLSRLVADGLDPYLVMTATRVFFERFRNPFDLFDEMLAMGVRKAHIERLTETGYARANWSRLGVDNAAYSKGMSRILKAYELWRRRDDNGALLNLSPFDGLMASVREMGEGRGGYGCWSGGCDTRFHTIDSSGYKRGCTALTSESDNKAANESLNFPLGFEEERRIRQIVDCSTCDFRSVCSSGCLALSMDDGSGECSGGRKLFEAAASVAISAYEKEVA